MTCSNRLAWCFCTAVWMAASAYGAEVSLRLEPAVQAAAPGDVLTFRIVATVAGTSPFPVLRSYQITMPCAATGTAGATGSINHLTIPYTVCTGHLSDTSCDFDGFSTYCYGVYCEVSRPEECPPPNVCIDYASGYGEGYCLDAGVCEDPSPDIDGSDPEFIFRPPPGCGFVGCLPEIHRGDCPGGTILPHIGLGLTVAAWKVLGPNYRGYTSEFVYRVSDDAHGLFVLAVEGISNPPTPSDETRFTGPGSPPTPIPLIPVSARVYVGVPPGCTMDAECEDGLFCNGIERCIAGTCQPGTPINCSDNVSCTIDSCNEATNWCEHKPDDAACNNGVFCDGTERCDVTLGCRSGTPPCAAEHCDEVNNQCPRTNVTLEPAMQTAAPGDVLNFRIIVTVVGEAPFPLVRGYQLTMPCALSGGDSGSIDHFTIPDATYCTMGPMDPGCNFDGVFTDCICSFCFPGFPGQCPPPDICVDDGLGGGCCQGGGFCERPSPRLDIGDPNFIFRTRPPCLGCDSTNSGMCPDGWGPRIASGSNLSAHLISGPRYYVGDFTYRVSGDARGDFVLALEGINNPPTGSDGTRFSGPGFPTMLIPLMPFSAVVHVEGPTTCTMDAECEDGLFCNGSERCVAGTCEAGTPVNCSDGISCTIGSCNEATNRCEHAPDDSACDNGLFCDGAETCIATLGCRSGTPPCPAGHCDEINDQCRRTNIALEPAVQTAAPGDVLNFRIIVSVAGIGPFPAVRAYQITMPCSMSGGDSGSIDHFTLPVVTSCTMGPMDPGCNFDGLFTDCICSFCSPGLPGQCPPPDVCVDDGLGGGCCQGGGVCVNLSPEVNATDPEYIFRPLRGFATDEGQCPDGGSPRLVNGVTIDQARPLLPGARYYVGDFTYRVSADARGDFLLAIQGISDPPTRDDPTRFTTPANPPTQVALTPFSAIVHVQVEARICTRDAECDDGRFCNGVERCVAGTCQSGTSINCSDGISCTIDACNEFLDACTHLPHDAPCNNGLFCDGVETCSATLGCRPGTPPCASEHCDEASDRCPRTHLMVEPAMQIAAPGDVLTFRIVATVTGAAPIPLVNGYQITMPCALSGGDNGSIDHFTLPDAPSPILDTGDPAYIFINLPPCPGCDTTNSGMCPAEPGPWIARGSHVSVDLMPGSRYYVGDFTYRVSPDARGDFVLAFEGINNPPTASDATWLSRSGFGLIRLMPFSAVVRVGPSLCTMDAECEDGLFCNGSERCVAGTCEAGTPVDCSDNVSCTIDSCNEATNWCQHKPDGAACDNGLFCDGAEWCDPAVGCRAGTPPCPAAHCDEASNQCFRLIVTVEPRMQTAAPGDMLTFRIIATVAGTAPFPPIRGYQIAMPCALSGGVKGSIDHFAIPYETHCTMGPMDPGCNFDGVFTDCICSFCFPGSPGQCPPPDICVDDGLGGGCCQRGGACVSPSPDVDSTDPEFIFRSPCAPCDFHIARYRGECSVGAFPLVANALSAGQFKLLLPGTRYYVVDFTYRVSAEAYGDFVLAMDGISAPASGFDLTRFSRPGFPQRVVTLTPFTAMVHVPQCAGDGDCGDGDACTCDRCVGGTCANTATAFGNVDCAGGIDSDDVSCVLDGFAALGACPNGDIAPGCAGDGVIDVDDVFATLDAVEGIDPCECP